MRKVTARELQLLGVGGGEPLALSEQDRVELAKAKILNELEVTHGNDSQMWLRILKRAEKRILKEPYHTAITQLIQQLEKELK